jgi:uncharacterized protein
VPQNIDRQDWLQGTPDLAKMWGYNAIPLADIIRIPTLVIDAQQEELLDVETNGTAVYERIRRNAIAEHKFFACDHYGIYNRPTSHAASDAAVDWFRRYL